MPDPAIEKFPNSTARLKVHTVRRGETIRGIARKYGTSPERLMRINGMRKPVIFPGQTLLLSGNVSRSSKAAKARVAAIRAENAKREVSRSTKKPTSTASRSKASASAKSASTKRSGAGSKAGARTTSKSAKRSAQAE